MGEMLRRLVWFAIVACAASYAVFLVLGSFLVAQAEDAGPVQVRDVLEPGLHRLSGMLPVPDGCDELLVRAEKVSGDTYQLLFSTWQDPSVKCDGKEVPRAFQAALFAPSTGVTFIASLDGKPFPVLVIPDLTDTISQ